MKIYKTNRFLIQLLIVLVIMSIKLIVATRLKIIVAAFQVANKL